MNDVKITLTYEQAVVLLEKLEDMIADARAEQRPMLIELHSQLTGQALKPVTEKDNA